MIAEVRLTQKENWFPIEFSHALHLQELLTKVYTTRLLSVGTSQNLYEALPHINMFKYHSIHNEISYKTISLNRAFLACHCKAKRERSVSQAKSKCDTVRNLIKELQ